MTIPFNEAPDALNRQFVDQLSSRLTAIQLQSRRINPKSWDVAAVESLYRSINGLPDLAHNFGMQQSLSDASHGLKNRLALLLRDSRPPSVDVWQTIVTDIQQLEQLSWMYSGPDTEQQTPIVAASPLLHIIGNDPALLPDLERTLKDDGFRTRVFARKTEFRTAFETPGAEPPAAIVMDIIFPDGDLTDAGLITQLSLGDVGGTPVIMASFRDDIPARLAAFRAGAYRYLVKPLDSTRLTDILEALTGRQPPKPYRVLLVDEDAVTLERHAAMLQSAGMQVCKLSEPLQIFAVLEDFSPDVALFDVHMPEASGPELAAILREHDAYLNLPILFLSAETDINQQLLALNSGGDGFLAKPLQAHHLVAAVTARARRARQNSSLQRRLETALYELEREHLAINQHALVSITDQTGMITYVNQQFCKISGYPRSELLGRNHRIVKSHKHSPEFYQNLWQTLANGQVWQGELCNQSKDGDLYWVESTITPFLDESGTPYQYISIHTNISHVKEVETALQLSEERYQLAVAATQDGMWDWDIETGRVYYSPRWEVMFGFEPGSVPQSLEAFTPLVHPDDVAGMFDEVQRYLRREISTYSREFRMMRRNGSQIWTLHQAVGIFDQTGKPLRLVGTTTDITSRKTAEVALRATLDSTQDGILAVDHAGYISFSNRLFSEMWQIPEVLIAGSQFEQGMLGHILDLLLNPDLFLTKIRNMHQSGQDTQDILEFKDGRLFESHSKPLLLDKSHPAGRVWSFRDITENKRGERALAESEWQLRQAQQVARLGSFDWRPLSGELQWSDEHFRLWGLAPQSSLPAYRLFKQGIDADDWPLVQTCLRQALQNGGTYECLHRVVWPDGSRHFIRNMGEVLFNDSGRPMRMFGCVQDVTGQVEVEQALIAARDEAERANQAKSVFLSNLMGNQEMLTQLISSPAFSSTDLSYSLRHVTEQIAKSVGVERVGLWSLSEDGEFMHCVSQWAVAIQQHSSGHELTARDFPAYFAAIKSAEIIVADDAHTHPATSEFSASYLTPMNINSLLGIPINARGQTWGVICCEQVGPAISWAPEQLVFASAAAALVAQTIEAVERRKVEASLKIAKDEAERANQAKSDFLASMSHELRTPMNAILGFGQLLEYDETLTANQQEDVQAILKAGHHLLELINEILDLAKVESGNIDLSLEPVDVVPVIEECLGLMSTLADKRSIRISHPDLAAITVRADRTRLKQALLNLLSNAVKYNREGGRVLVEVQPKGDDRINILITDTGPGIPAERLKELFQPFKRLEAEYSNIEGTGIGLTITRRIVEMMGGTVDVLSEVGIGSTFRIELPLESMPTRTASHAHNMTDAGTATDTVTEHSVLYIEDNPVNIKLMAQILARDKRIRLITAHTPEWGIELARTQLPKLVLLDINLPGMDGFGVLQRLREDQATSNIPVIAITANAMSRDYERGMAAGFTDYLTKPLDVAAFVKVLERTLNNHPETAE